MIILLGKLYKCLCWFDLLHPSPGARGEATRGLYSGCFLLVSGKTDRHFRIYSSFATNESFVYIIFRDKICFNLSYNYSFKKFLSARKQEQYY